MFAFLLSWLMGVGSGAAISPPSAFDFSFPSADVRSARSLSLSVSYDGGSRLAGGVREYGFSLADHHGRKIGEFAFTRSVDGSWSPEGDGVFVNNYEGSNLVDCLILARRGRPRLVSLIDLLRRRGAVTEQGIAALGIPESPENSHFYLACERWLSNDTVEVSIRGYVDTVTDFGREFSYSYRVSTVEGIFEPNRP